MNCVGVLIICVALCAKVHCITICMCYVCVLVFGYNVVIFIYCYGILRGGIHVGTCGMRELCDGMDVL